MCIYIYIYIYIVMVLSYITSMSEILAIYNSDI